MLKHIDKNILNEYFSILLVDNIEKKSIWFRKKIRNLSILIFIVHIFFLSFLSIYNKVKSLVRKLFFNSKKS